MGSQAIKPLFKKGSSQVSLFILLLLASCVLLSLERYTNVLKPIRYYTNSIASPFYRITYIPVEVKDWLNTHISSRFDLIEANKQLSGQVLLQQAELQKMQMVISENNRLRALMNSSERIKDTIVVAELIGISPDPKKHKVIINKGSRAGVYEGQAVLDAFGLLGQVTMVSPTHAEVLFITDDSQAIPVQNNRNGVRTVVEGIGDLYKLRLRYVPSTMDVKKGDLLISSGLGGRFPVGYPVAEIQEVINDPGQPFATVYAMPTAKLNRSRYVLLVFPEGWTEQSLEQQAEQNIEQQSEQASEVN